MVMSCTLKPHSKCKNRYILASAAAFSCQLQTTHVCPGDCIALHHVWHREALGKCCSRLLMSCWQGQGHSLVHCCLKPAGQVGQVAGLRREVHTAGLGEVWREWRARRVLLFA